MSLAGPQKIGDRIGFMQGRLSPQVNGLIQAFPWKDWQDEFPAAKAVNLCKMEWTLDHSNVYQNPLMSQMMRKSIKRLMNQNSVQIPSLTGDCFMQVPFWKEPSNNTAKLIQIFRDIIFACGDLGLRYVVVPLVDHGRLETRIQENNLVTILHEQIDCLIDSDIMVLFEIDYFPAEVARFIDRFDPKYFGINYDTGNSAALGFKSSAEITEYGKRIYNVHIKDRLLGGTTVPLTEGNANFSEIFQNLGKISYTGNYILQTARATDGRHVSVIERYRNFVCNQIGEWNA